MEPVKRIILFVFGCVVVRSLLIWWASRDETVVDDVQWAILGTLTLFMSLGFLRFGIGRKVGWVKMKGGAGGNVYWNSFLHSLLYFLFTILWFLRTNDAYFILIADLLIGIFIYFVPNYLKLFLG